MSRFIMDETIEDGCLILKPKGRIDSVTARIFNDGLTLASQRSPAGLIVDFTDVQYMSSVGFRHLIVAANQAQAASRRFVLCSLSNEMRNLFESCGMLDLFDIHDDSVTAAA